jgi:signal transduction histidine kinase
VSVLLNRLNRRAATMVRLIGLALLTWTVFAAHHSPGTSGRGLVITIAFAAAAAAWVVWTIRPLDDRGITPEIYVMAAAGGLLTGASPGSAASAFVFVAVVVAGVRVQLTRAFPVVVVGTMAVAISMVLYKGSALGLLAYALGFAAGALAASNSRQSLARAEQAELLLAQTQRSHEEQLRAARLEESTRIAREIHDVLAHTLAGLTIQLEATSALVQQGADRDTVLARIQRAHDLARDGLRETRRAVGALRGDRLPASAGIEALVADYRSAADASARLTFDGDADRLAGATGETVTRVIQEALTNVLKHARGADVSVAVHAGEGPGQEVVVVVDDRPRRDRPPPQPSVVAASGGGYGLRGMHERAAALGGTVSAGPDGDGWRVELRLPPPDAPETGAPATNASAAPASSTRGSAADAPTSTMSGGRR